MTTMFDNLSHSLWQALRHVVEILPAGILGGCGLALGLNQDRKYMLV